MAMVRPIMRVRVWVRSIGVVEEVAYIENSFEVVVGAGQGAGRPQ